MMLNCMIIDDDIMARKSLEHLCQKADGLNIVSMFDNAQQGLDFLLKDSVDLIFLDIEMPDITGLEFIEQARALPQVIFTTSNTDYAYDAFEYQVTDFLKKPITLPRFTLAVDKAKEIQKQNNEYKANAREVYIKESGRYTRLAYDEILYFENMGDYIKVQTREQGYVIHGTLKAIETKLKSGEFLKVHRSFIVNLKQIKDIEDNSLVIDKKVIPISRANKPVLMGKINLL